MPLAPRARPSACMPSSIRSKRHDEARRGAAVDIHRHRIRIPNGDHHSTIALRVPLGRLSVTLSSAPLGARDYDYRRRIALNIERREDVGAHPTRHLLDISCRRGGPAIQPRPAGDFLQRGGTCYALPLHSERSDVKHTAAYDVVHHATGAVRNVANTVATRWTTQASGFTSVRERLEPTVQRALAHPEPRSEFTALAARFRSGAREFCVRHLARQSETRRGQCFDR